MPTSYEAAEQLTSLDIQVDTLIAKLSSVRPTSPTDSHVLTERVNEISSLDRIRLRLLGAILPELSDKLTNLLSRSYFNELLNVRLLDHAYQRGVRQGRCVDTCDMCHAEVSRRQGVTCYSCHDRARSHRSMD